MLLKTEFVKARSLEEAFCAISDRADASFVAGGTDLFVQIKEAKRKPSRLVSVREVPELLGIGLQRGSVVIGSAVPLSDVASSALVAGHAPLVADACLQIGSPQVRNRGTIGGNIGNASPAGDSITALIASGARIRVKSLAGEREILLEASFLGPGKTVLSPDELITAVVVPVIQDHTRVAFEKYALRGGMDIAIVNVAISLDMADGLVTDARIALGAVAPTPIRAVEAERTIRGNHPSSSLIEEAARVAARECCPIDDVRGTASYRRHLVYVLTKRALAKVCQGNVGRVWGCAR